MIIVKVHRVFPSNYVYIASSRQLQLHRINIGDSKAIVTPFMQDGTYPPRNFATFGPSELQPPFTGVYYTSLNLCIFTLQHRAGVRFYSLFFNLAESCVFIKQSLPSILCYLFCKSFFSLSYKSILPSSFNVFFSIILIIFIHPPVLVSGTV